MEFIDFIFVNCCLILNIKSVKILKKKTFCRWKFSNVLLAFVFLNIESVKMYKKTF
jgi:hypothetical protein